MAPAPLRSTKIVTLDRLVELREQARRDGRTLVQCHGCFDIVHPGHVRHLQHAARQGDLLLVSITGDTGVNKGVARPLFTQDLRAENLAALDCVDWVYVNAEPTAENLLATVEPDVYVKGKEYESNEDERFAAERRAVESGGGRVFFSSGDVVFSSSALIESIGSGGLGGEHLHAPAYATLSRLEETHDLSPATLARTIERIAGQRVVVVGETVLDTYIQCDRPDVAGDGPMLSLRPIDERTFDGGAAIVALHAAAMGADVTLVTALPESPMAQAFRERMAWAGVDVHAVRDEGAMLEKQRFLVGRDKVMKVVRVRRVELDARARDRFAEAVVEASKHADTAIVADFGLGLLGPNLLKGLSERVRPNVRILAGDVSGRRASLLSIRGADWLSPSEQELREAMRDYDSSLPAVVWGAMQRAEARAIVTTLGPEGAIAFSPRKDADPESSWTSRVESEHIPSLIPNAIDPLGCGDAMLAAGALSLGSGASLTVAAYIGSIAAAIASTVLGNEAVSAGQLVSATHRLAQSRLIVQQNVGLDTNASTRMVI